MSNEKFQDKLDLALNVQSWRRPARLFEQLQKPLATTIFNRKGMYNVHMPTDRQGREPIVKDYPRCIRLSKANPSSYVEARAKFLQFERFFSQILYPTTLREAKNQNRINTDHLTTFFAKIGERCQWTEDERKAVIEEAKVIVKNAAHEKRLAETPLGDDFLGVALTEGQPSLQGGFYRTMPVDVESNLRDSHVFMNRYFIEFAVGEILFRVPAQSVFDKDDLEDSLFPALPTEKQNYYNLHEYGGPIYAKGPDCYETDKKITFVECSDLIHLSIPGKGRMQVWVESPKGVGGYRYKVPGIRKGLVPELSFGIASI